MSNLQGKCYKGVCIFVAYAISICMSSKLDVINKIDWELQAHLFSHVSTETLPLLDKSKPINVTLGIEMKKIVGVEERAQKFKIKVWRRMSWLNELITWDPKDWGNITKTKVTPNKLWTPDIFPYNEMDERGDNTDKYDKLILLLANGMNYWYVPVVYVLSCNIDVRYFPFDVQRCPVTFGSWEHDMSGLQIFQDDNQIITHDYKNSSEWDILKTSVESEARKYDCCVNPYSVLSFTFVIHRRALYYIYNIVLPCTALMLMVLFSFFLPPDSGERIAVVITVLLAFTLFLQFINQSLPKNSDATPVLSVFYTAIMAESTLSLCTTCIVLIMHYRGKENWTTPLPKWIKALFFRKGSKKEVPHEAKVYNKNKNKNIVSLVKGNKQSDDSMKENGVTTKLLAPQYADNVCNMMDQFTNQNYLLEEILREMNVLTDQVKEGKEKEENEEEWLTFSKIIDRFFFFMFVFLFVVSSVTILLPAYYEHEENDH